MRSRRLAVLSLTTVGCLPIPWMVLSHVAGLDLPAELVALLSGMAILGCAFMVSWSAELAERDLPQALAILALALVAVLPEYAVDLHFAWTAGKDLSYAHYAVANMTGANRLLIGVGWPAVVFIACWRSKASELVLDRSQRLEIRFLLWATLYSFAIPLTGTVTLFDAAVLLAIFGLYVHAAVRGEPVQVELVGTAALLDRYFSDRGRRAWALFLFAFAAYGIFISAESFAESLVAIGRHSHIDEFLLVQWVAPLASESPEFIIATLFGWKLRGSLGIGALISSKVNQWTLLVGAIPIAFALSSAGIAGLPLNARQTEELILTSAQSLLAGLLIANLRFSRGEAMVLITLFLGQFLFTSTEVRYGFIACYLAITAGMLIFGSSERRAAFLSLLLPGGAADGRAARTAGKPQK